MVGAVGFGVDAAVLQLLVGAAGWSPFAARALSFPGALINLGVFALCLLAAPPLYERPVIALGIGALVALLFNFAASRRLVFRA